MKARYQKIIETNPLRNRKSVTIKTVTKHRQRTLYSNSKASYTPTKKDRFKSTVNQVSAVSAADVKEIINAELAAIIQDTKFSMRELRIGKDCYGANKSGSDDYDEEPRRAKKKPYQKQQNYSSHNQNRNYSNNNYQSNSYSPRNNQQNYNQQQQRNYSSQNSSNYNQKSYSQPSRNFNNQNNQRSSKNY